MILKAPLPHRITAVLMAFLATLFLSLSLLSPAMAREMVSVKGKLVNMRSGPGTRYQVNWQLEKGYPLQIIARKGKWLKVRDFENDQGWISRSVTTSTSCSPTSLNWLPRLPISTPVRRSSRRRFSSN